MSRRDECLYYVFDEIYTNKNRSYFEALEKKTEQMAAEPAASIRGRLWRTPWEQKGT